VNLFVKKSGQGDIPLVLLHGWGTSAAVFEPLIPLLASKFEIFSVDLPGFGQSPWIPNLTPEKMAALVVAQINKPAVYLGWSMGSLVALCAAHDFAEHTLAYINVTGTPAFSQYFWPFGISVKGLTQFAKQIRLAPEQVRKDFIDLHFRHSAIDATLKTNVVTELNATPSDPEALIVTTDWLGSIDLRPMWQNLRVPTLSLLAEKDILLPVAAAHELKTLNASTQLEVIPKASHMPFLDMPSVFVTLLTQFVENHVS